MEHSPLTLTPSEMCTKSLWETCLRLGRTVPSFSVERHPGFIHASGKSDHPLCNFAIDLDLNPNVCYTLAEISVSTSSFRVYLSPQDQPSHAHDLLTTAGFGPSQTLIQMVAAGERTSAHWPHHVAGNQQERKEVADFMTTQFFDRHPAAFKNFVASATANAEDFDLRFQKEGGRIIAAAALHKSEGFSGIYNLCVDHSLRGRGCGKAFLNDLLSTLPPENGDTVLHCSPNLSSWYTSFGFKPCGKTIIYSFIQGSLL